MRRSLKRAVALGLACPALALGSVVGPTDAAGVLFAFRPGPIERPLAIATADFDRDGREDIAIANFEAGTIQILLAQPDGTYAGLTGPFGVGSANIGTPTSGPFVLLVTDMNPDDVDGDGVKNAVDDCPNVYDPIDSTTGKQPDSDGNGVGDACQILKDTNNDGVPDPIDTDGDGVPDYDPVTLRLDNCPRMPNPGQEDNERAQGPDGVCNTADDLKLLYGPDGLCGTADDRIGDGVGDACAFSPDLVVLTTSQVGTPFGGVRIRLNDGEGGLVGRPSLFTGVAPGGIALADFTGDGLLDLVITNSPNGLLQFLPGAGDGNFSSQAVLTAGKGPQGLVPADLNGDGKLDLAVGNRTDNTMSIYLNSGAGLPSSPTATVPTLPTFPTNPPPTVCNGTTDTTCLLAPTDLLTGRLNADTLDDLVVLDQGSSAAGGSIEVFLGAANGIPVAGQTILLGKGHQPRGGFLKDLDGNGTLDLVVADFTGGQAFVFAGQGDGTFADPATTTLATGGQPSDVAPLEIDTPAPGRTDLAVLDFKENRILLYLNEGALTFTPAPSSPASPWSDTSAMALFGVDTLAGADILMVQRQTARLDLLSGIGNGFFRADPTQTIQGLSASLPADVEDIAVGDFQINNRLDIAALDRTAGRVTVLTNQPTDTLQEGPTFSVGPGTARLGSGSLFASIDDIDRDGVPNVLDDCPTIYNPRCLVLGDAGCTVTSACKDIQIQNLTPCDPSQPATLDPVTGQCDSDHNGIGDQCQILTSDCLAIDSDFDLKVDYDPHAINLVNGAADYDKDLIPNALDNCPTVPNNDQADSNGNGVGDACEILSSGLPVDPDGDGVPTFDPVTLKLDDCPAIYNPGQEENYHDGVGNACTVTAALDNCPHTSNFTQTDTNGDGVGDSCAFPPVDLLAPDPATGQVLLFAGDSTGSFHPAAASPLTGLVAPTAAVPGPFNLACIIPSICLGDPTLDVAVADRGVAGDFSDDRVVLYLGDGLGGFSALPPAPATGDPDNIIVALEQPICGFAGDPLNPGLRLDPDGQSAILAAVEPGTSTVGIYLITNQHALNPALSSLQPPVAHPAPLPAPAPLRSAVMTDVNHDGKQDIVTLSSQPGGPSQVTVFIALGNGLFFTDDSFKQAQINDEITLMVAGNTRLATNVFFPDLVLFSVRDEAPLVMTNVMQERADIDGSGRVDGYDLALLASAFGAVRGEDFTILPDATLLQAGSGFTRTVVGGGSFVPGQELPGSGGICNSLFDPLTGPYGLPVDINLDGVVDGVDLAILASMFGQSLQAP